MNLCIINGDRKSQELHSSTCIQLRMTKHPSRKVINFRYLLGCDTFYGNDEIKFRTAMTMACSFLQAEEIYPDQEKALTGFLKEAIFSSARTQSVSDLNKNTISLQNREKRTVADVGKQY